MVQIYTIQWRTVRNFSRDSSSFSNRMRLNVGNTLLHGPHHCEYSSTTALQLPCHIQSALVAQSYFTLLSTFQPGFAEVLLKDVVIFHFILQRRQLCSHLVLDKLNQSQGAVQKFAAVVPHNTSVQQWQWPATCPRFKRTDG